jgi:hypothetical protein
MRLPPLPQIRNSCPIVFLLNLSNAPTDEIHSTARTGILLLLLFSGFISCKKHKIEKRYTGDFLFSVHSHTWNMSSGTHDTTYNYEGKIEMMSKFEGMTKGKIYIKIYYKSSSHYDIAEINQSGRMYFIPMGGGGTNSTIGEGSFTGEDELDIHYTRQALSSSVDEVVHGVRR